MGANLNPKPSIVVNFSGTKQPLPSTTTELKSSSNLINRYDSSKNTTLKMQNYNEVKILFSAYLARVGVF